MVDYCEKISLKLASYIYKIIEFNRLPPPPDNNF